MSTVADAVRPAGPTHRERHVATPRRASRPDPPNITRTAARSGPRWRELGGPRWQRVAGLTIAGVVTLLAATAVVLYLIGPLVHARQQRALLSSERTTIIEASRDTEGLHRAALPTLPPEPGSVVGILTIPSIGLRQAVVEGVGPSQTMSGPGHVPGTAGLGQPGNSAVVGRRAGYGGPFAHLGDLRAGDRILTATTEGRSAYVVRTVRTEIVTTPVTPATVLQSSGTPTSGSTTTIAPTKASRLPATGSSSATGRGSSRGPSTVSADRLYGPSPHDQITLVTSGSSVPWNSDLALVVVARMQGQPYTPTPQESRSPSQEGNSGDPAALAWLLLATLALAACFAGALVLYRRSTLRSAYLLTTAPLLAFTVLAAEALSRLMPAWL